jgi:hypothetical protein
VAVLRGRSCAVGEALNGLRSSSAIRPLLAHVSPALSQQPDQFHVGFIHVRARVIWVRRAQISALDGRATWEKAGQRLGPGE